MIIKVAEKRLLFVVILFLVALIVALVVTLIDRTRQDQENTRFKEAAREVLSIYHDGYDDPKERPVDQYTVLTEGRTVRKFFDIGPDRTIDEVWRPGTDSGWHIEFRRNRERNEMSKERAQELFDQVLKLTPSLE